MKSSTNNIFTRSRCPKSSVVSIPGLKQVVLVVIVALVAWIGATPAVGGQCPWDLLYTFDGEVAYDLFGY